jgi:hypothetical protein
MCNLDNVVTLELRIKTSFLVIVYIGSYLLKGLFWLHCMTANFPSVGQVNELLNKSEGLIVICFLFKSTELQYLAHVKVFLH